MIDIALIFLLCVVAWYWWDTTYCNELALQSCRTHCDASDLQLLDGSVVRRRIWLRRNETSAVQICRLYSFEYSDDSESRHYGYIVLLGHRVAETSLESHRLH